MRATITQAAIAVLAVVVFFVLTLTEVSFAQGVPVKDSVTINHPDGGLEVSVTIPDGGLFTRLNVPDGGIDVAVPSVVRVVGPTFGEVQVSGTVGLSSASLFALGSDVCVTSAAHRHTLTTTPEIIPANLPDGGSGALEGRTGWTVVNIDSVKRVSCLVDPGDGGVPDCDVPGSGITVFPNGGSLTYSVRQSNTVRCVACTNGATIEHVEEACTPP